VQLSLDKLVERIKKSPRFAEVGMIACHLGIVRGYSRNGKPIKKINIKINQKMIERIIHEVKALSGIIEVLVEVREGTFSVGEPILAIAIAGSFREDVLLALERIINSIKTKAVNKEEIGGEHD